MRSGGEFYALEWIMLILTDFVQYSLIRISDRNGFRSAISQPAQLCDSLSNLFIGVDSSDSDAGTVAYQDIQLYSSIAELTKMIFERRPPDFGGLCSSLQRILNEISNVQKKILK